MERILARLLRRGRRKSNKRVKIVTDSTADLPEEIAGELGIIVVPCNVVFGDEVYRDGIDLCREEFYQKLIASEVIPTTSQPSTEQFKELYESLAGECEGIVSIHLAEELSGTLDSVRLAAQDLPNLNIAVIDSRSASMGLGLVTIVAAKAARRGCSLEEIVRLVRESIQHLRVFAMLDTLEYIERAGRIGKTSAFFGALFRLKPIIQISDGELLPIERVRTRQKALARLVELMGELAPFEELGILHCQVPDSAQQLIKMLAPIHPKERIIVAEAGPIVGAYAGPGAIGIASILAADEDTGSRELSEGK